MDIGILENNEYIKEDNENIKLLISKEEENIKDKVKEHLINIEKNNIHKFKNKDTNEYMEIDYNLIVSIVEILENTTAILKDRLLINEPNKIMTKRYAEDYIKKGSCITFIKKLDKKNCLYLDSILNDILNNEVKNTIDYILMKQKINRYDKIKEIINEKINNKK